MLSGADQIASKANIEVLPFTQVISAAGENHLERIEVRLQAPHEAEKILGYETDALFVMIGADACTSWLPMELERDPRGYLCTGRDLTTWKLDVVGEEGIFLWRGASCCSCTPC